MAGDFYDMPNQEVVRVGPVGPGEPKDAEAFDPSDFTVEEVKAYVDANPDAVQDVYDAELSGKARTTLLEWLSE